MLPLGDKKVFIKHIDPISGRTVIRSKPVKVLEYNEAIRRSPTLQSHLASLLKDPTMASFLTVSYTHV